VAGATNALQLIPIQLPMLRETIAESHDLEASNFFVGNGSDEVLAHTFKPT
jgi:histidinol-phosphate aminotransferase